MVDLSTLKRIAIYGAVGTTLFGVFVHHKVQAGLANGDHYKKSVAALRNDERVVKSLGPPIRTTYLNLRDPSNFVTPDRAQLSIPIKGSKYKGHLHSRCSRKSVSEPWMIESLTIEVNNATFPVSFTNKTDKEDITDS